MKNDQNNAYADGLNLAHYTQGRGATALDNNYVAL